MDGHNIVICLEIYTSENEKSGISLSTGVLEPYLDGWSWCFSHGWSVIEMQFFVDSLVFNKCWVYAGAFFKYIYTPLSAEDMFLKSLIWQQCNVACKKWCGKEGLMQGLKTCTAFKYTGTAYVVGRVRGRSRLSESAAGRGADFYRCWVLERIIILKNNSHSEK